MTPMQYSRYLAPGFGDGDLELARQTVRDQLSACADPRDDPTAFGDQVLVDEYPDTRGGVLVVGRLDETPRAPYLEPGYDPWADVPDDVREVGR